MRLFRRRRPTAAPPQEAAPALPTRIKSEYALHTWTVTGGYDPAEDGEVPSFGCIAIACGRCGETRRVGCALDDIRLRFGCARDYFTGRYEPGDHVIVGDRLDSSSSTCPTAGA